MGIIQTILRPIHKIAKTLFGIPLNQNQASVLDWITSPKQNSGPLKVEAAAGTGKTGTLVALTAHLINEIKVDPSRICLTTFTKDAADEMYTRLSKIVGTQAANSVFIGTTHKLFWQWLLKVVKNVPRYSNLLGTDNTSKQCKSGKINSIFDIVKCIFESGVVTKKTLVDGQWMDVPIYSDNGTPIEFVPKSERFNIEDEEFAKIDFGNFASAIGLLHANLISIDSSNASMLEIVNRINDPLVNTYIQKVYSYYENAKQLLNVIDFDDMINLFNKEIVNNNKNLSYARNRFDIILVDEAQDLNLAQLTNLIEISKKNNKIGNLAMIGDVCQCIYSWRGASNIFKNFDTLYGARVVQLNINYRSIPSIVETADVIREKLNDTLLMNGHIKTEPSSLFIELNSYEDTISEANAIADKIYDSYVESGESKTFNFKDYAVLVRVNALVGPLQIGLITRGIPFVSPKASGFFTLQEIQKCLAYLRAIVSYQNKKPVNGEDIVLCANFPQRRLGPAFTGPIRKWMSCAVEGCYTLANKRGKGVNHTKAKEVADLIKKAAFTNGIPNTLQTAWEVINRAISGSGISESVSESSSTSENLNMFENIIENFKWNTIEKFLEVVNRATQATTDSKDEVNAVTVTTIHRAKGLEWKEVFLMGMMENVFPHFRTLQIDNGTYEERCLWYVAWTRAKENIHISWSNFFNEKPMSPSRFLGETLQKGRGLELFTKE